MKRGEVTVLSLLATILSLNIVSAQVSVRDFFYFIDPDNVAFLLIFCISFLMLFLSLGRFFHNQKGIAAAMSLLISFGIVYAYFRSGLDLTSWFSFIGISDALLYNAVLIIVLIFIIFFIYKFGFMRGLGIVLMILAGFLVVGAWTDLIYEKGTAVVAAIVLFIIAFFLVGKKKDSLGNIPNVRTGNYNPYAQPRGPGLLRRAGGAMLNGIKATAGFFRDLMGASRAARAAARASRSAAAAARSARTTQEGEAALKEATRQLEEAGRRLRQAEIDLQNILREAQRNPSPEVKNEANAAQREVKEAENEVGGARKELIATQDIVNRELLRKKKVESNLPQLIRTANELGRIRNPSPSDSARLNQIIQEIKLLRSNASTKDKSGEVKLIQQQERKLLEDKRSKRKKNEELQEKYIEYAKRNLAITNLFRGRIPPRGTPQYDQYTKNTNVLKELENLARRNRYVLYNTKKQKIVG